MLSINLYPDGVNILCPLTIHGTPPDIVNVKGTTKPPVSPVKVEA